MDVLKAIAEIRKRLDEIEELVQHLPEPKQGRLTVSSYIHRPTKEMVDWMDENQIIKKERVRCGLLRVAKLADDGMPIEQIKRHRIIRSKTSMAQYVDDFHAKWISR